MDKVLLLGINGFTGRHFQEYIRKNNLLRHFLFVGVDKNIDKLIDIKYLKSNLSVYKNLESLLITKRPVYIINLIGILHSNCIGDLIKINADISRDILDIILQHNLKIKKVLFIGSAAEYGLPKRLPVKEDAPLNPISAYGLSKVIQSHYINYYSHNYDMNVNVARTFNVIGKYISSELSVGSFLREINNARNGQNIHVGNLNTKRDFIDIEDAIDGYWRILLNGKRGKMYNLCSGRSVYMRDILTYMIKKSGKKINIIVNKKYIKQSDVSDIYGDHSKVSRDTGWKSKSDIFSAINKII